MPFKFCSKLQIISAKIRILSTTIISRPVRLKYKMNSKILIILCSLGLFLSCQSAAEKDQQLLAKDTQSKTAINKINAEVRGTGKISVESFEKLKALHEKYPNSVEINKIYKNALVIRGDLETLEKFLTRDNPEELSLEDKKNLAKLYVKKGKYEKSLEMLKALRDKHPNDIELRGLTGLSFFHMGKMEEAGKEFDSVWNEIIENKKVEEIATRGIIYFRRNDLPKAIETLEKAIEIEPDNLSANYTLSRIYSQQGDAEKAAEYSQKTDKLQNQMKAETFAKSRQVKLIYDLQNAWNEKRYSEVVNLANQMLPTANDDQQKLILYQYLYESNKALGKQAEAQKALAEAQNLKRQ